jgi:hypothetical protein
LPGANTKPDEQLARRKVESFMLLARFRALAIVAPLVATLRGLMLAGAMVPAASFATPPLPPRDRPQPQNEVSVIPPEYHDHRRPLDGLLFPPVPPRRDQWEEDPLGDVWEMSEVASWSGVWIRRGRTPIFDGYWTNPNGERVRTTLDIRRQGNEVVAIRRHPDGQGCRYQGRVAPDGVEVSGRYTCSWERTPMNWRAQIIRMEDVTPALLRRGW